MNRILSTVIRLNDHAPIAVSGPDRMWSWRAQPFSTIGSVLGFGKNIPAEVTALFAQKPDSAEAAATRAAFAKRGKAVKTAWRRKRSLTRAVAKLSGLLSSITGGTQRAR